MTNEEALAELRSFEAANRRHRRWRDKFVQRIDAKLEAKLLEELKKLSPKAARLMNAMEEDGCDFDPTAEPSPDPNPAPDWLNTAPPPLAPGAMLEVPERKAKRA